MSVGRILTLGFGDPFAGIKFLPTLGYLGTGGAVVEEFDGLGMAGGLTYFKTTRRPVIVLPDTTNRSEISGDLNPDVLNKVSYKINGDLP